MVNYKWNKMEGVNFWFLHIDKEYNFGGHEHSNIGIDQVTKVANGLMAFTDLDKDMAVKQLRKLELIIELKKKVDNK